MGQKEVRASAASEIELQNIAQVACSAVAHQMCLISGCIGERLAMLVMILVCGTLRVVTETPTSPRFKSSQRDVEERNLMAVSRERDILRSHRVVRPFADRRRII